MPRACARSMICARLRLSSATGSAAQRVVAAQGHEHHADVAVEGQSSRLRPPADVSPEMPAFTTW